MIITSLIFSVCVCLEEGVGGCVCTYNYMYCFYYPTFVYAPRFLRLSPTVPVRFTSVAVSAYIHALCIALLPSSVSLSLFTTNTGAMQETAQWVCTKITLRQFPGLADLQDVHTAELYCELYGRGLLWTMWQRFTVNYMAEVYWELWQRFTGNYMAEVYCELCGRGLLWTMQQRFTVNCAAEVYCELFGRGLLWTMRQRFTVNYAAEVYCELCGRGLLWTMRQRFTVNYVAEVYCELCDRFTVNYVEEVYCELLVWKTLPLLEHRIFFSGFQYIIGLMVSVNESTKSESDFLALSTLIRFQHFHKNLVKLKTNSQYKSLHLTSEWWVDRLLVIVLALWAVWKLLLCESVDLST